MSQTNWKDTLNMPQTSFQMKAGLVSKEPEYRKKWLSDNIYRKALEQNKGNQKFILHDGPPYANGDLHVGHALNKILKDIIVRYKTLQGFYSPYVMGWDTHGLPIENKVLKEMNKTQKDLSVIELRKKAEKYALTQVENQKEQFKTFQLFTDAKDYYVTLDKKYESNQLKLFKKMALDGLIYKGLKPVYWSPSSQSALAEAEVEYADHMSPSILVALKVIKGNKLVAKNDNLIIWTTTPWTLIANAGVAVGQNFEYSLVRANEENFVIASQLIESVAKLSKWSEHNVLKTFLGKDLLGLEYQRPVKKELSGPVILGHHVTLDSGSGLVHMAPLFGEDDFQIGKKEKLDMIMHVGDDGTLNSEAGKYEGLFYEDSNKEVGMFIDAEGKLLSLKFMKHSYPHDWRTNKPIIYRGTPQWFVSIDKIKKNILKGLTKIKSKPQWGISRISKMIENRFDWTISRQRAWGVPIPIFYDEKEQPVIKADIFDYVIKLVEEHGSNIWFEKTVDELLPEKYRNLNWTKEKDIMDVWFDSGSSWLAVKPEGESSPFDLYLEGNDQYRGWFNSSLINSYAYQNKAPFKQLVSHGFVLDGKNQKMSKSKGNVISPHKIISKNGADILRLWVANSEFTSDVTISDDIMKQNIEIYRKIRNTFKFMLGNLFDFKPEDVIELSGVHLLIKERLNNLKAEIITSYDNYDFLKLVKLINKFLVDTSSYYFEIHKDALYADAPNSNDRRMVQSNIYNIAKTLNIALAPILPTTMEEIYKELKGSKISIHLESFFKTNEVSYEEEKKWKPFFKLKDKVNQKIEKEIKSGNVKRVNQVYLTIKSDDEFINGLNLKKLLMVAKVKYGNEIEVNTFDSVKCPRCWNHFETKELTNEICQRCNDVINA